MRRGIISKWISGTPSRPFALFHSPWTDRPRSQRTLMVVNFNWEATLDRIVTWSFLYPRVPLDVDFVLVQPYQHALCLSNPWSDQGKLGYLSLMIAHENLPGYRDYQFINDDSPFFFANVQFDARVTLQSWTNAHWDQHANNMLFKNVTFPSGRDWWQWWSDGHVARDDDELKKLGFNSRGDNRSEDALLAMGYDPEIIYYCDACSDAFHIVQSNMSVFMHFARIFGQHAVFLEVAVPTLFNYGKLRTFDDAPFFHARFYEARDYPEELYSFGNDDGRRMHWVCIHPCKPSIGRCQWFMFNINGWPKVGQPFDSWVRTRGEMAGNQNPDLTLY